MDPAMAYLGGSLVCGAIWFIIDILIMIYMYKDAKKRGKSGVLWLIIGFFLGILGLIIWLIVRPPEPSFYQQQQNYQQPPPPPQ